MGHNNLAQYYLLTRALKLKRVNNCYLEIWGFTRLYKHRLRSCTLIAVGLNTHFCVTINGRNIAKQYSTGSRKTANAKFTFLCSFFAVKMSFKKIERKRD